MGQMLVAITSSTSEGIALTTRLVYCKPGVVPNHPKRVVYSKSFGKIVVLLKN